PGPVRRHLHRLGRELPGLVGRGRDQVLHGRGHGLPHHLRHRHRGLLRRRLELRRARRGLHRLLHPVPRHAAGAATRRALPLPAALRHVSLARRGPDPLHLRPAPRRHPGARLEERGTLPVPARRHRLHRDLLSRPPEHRQAARADLRRDGDPPRRRARAAQPRRSRRPRPILIRPTSRETPMTATYQLPTVREELPAPERTAYLIPSGDLRESANVPAWPFQQELERIVGEAVEAAGWSVRRAFEPDPVYGHGFIRSQRMGIEVFKDIPPEAPLIVATANWQYSHHVLAGLRTHRGPILTVANFAPEWPGLVGLLILKGWLSTMDRDDWCLWTVVGADAWCSEGVATWLTGGEDEPGATLVRPLPAVPTTPEVGLGRALAEQLMGDKAI